MDIRQTLRDSYNNAAAGRDGAAMQEWKAEPRDRFLQMLREEHKASIVDIGSGTGRDGCFFTEHGLQVVAIDLSDEMVRLCINKGIEAHRLDYHDLGGLGRKFDAAWAMNSLLHVQKAELENVLKEIRVVLNPDGLFFMGVYGGVDQEGIWEGDSYTPKRFFSFFTDEDIQTTVSAVFDIVRFDRVETGEKYHFQSIIMRKR